MHGRAGNREEEKARGRGEGGGKVTCVSLGWEHRKLPNLQETGKEPEEEHRP